MQKNIKNDEKVLGSLILLLLCFFSYSSFGQQSDTTRQQSFAAPTGSFLPIDTSDYRIKYGDRLRIRNLTGLTDISPESSGVNIGSTSSGTRGSSPGFESLIDRNGQVALPYVGRVKLAGLTRLEAAKEIEAKYKNVLEAPLFDIEIINLRIKVLGAVNNQGVFALESEKITLGEAIARAGGIDFTVADKTIKLVRTRQGKQEEITFDVRDLGNPAVTNIPVYDGEYVFVPPSKGSLKAIKNQRTAGILQPVGIALNALAVLITLYITLR
jgi:polysaccharide biosynthesis/export protein